LERRDNMTDLEFVEHLKRLHGALSYDGDASVQVVFYLTNGGVLRIGVTDEDVAAQPGLWADQYAGLPITPNGGLIDASPPGMTDALSAVCLEARNAVKVLDRLGYPVAALVDAIVHVDSIIVANGAGG
jgi:hypothetical protein